MCIQVQQFLRYVKDIYKKLPVYLPKIFEQHGQMKVHDLTEVNVEAALEETFTTTTILTEKRNAENQPISVSNQYQHPFNVNTRQNAIAKCKKNMQVQGGAE